MYPMEIKLTMIKDADHVPKCLGVVLLENDTERPPSSQIAVGVKSSSTSTSEPEADKSSWTEATVLGSSTSVLLMVPIA